MVASVKIQELPSGWADFSLLWGALTDPFEPLFPFLVGGTSTYSNFRESTVNVTGPLVWDTLSDEREKPESWSGLPRLSDWRSSLHRISHLV